MKQLIRIISVPIFLFYIFPLVVLVASCSHSSDRFVSKHDTINVYWINPSNGQRAWNRGVYDTKRMFTATDSGSTSGTWTVEKVWQVEVVDSIRDPKTKSARYDSAHKTWISRIWYTLDRHYVQPDSLPYKN